MGHFLFANVGTDYVSYGKNLAIGHLSTCIAYGI